MYQHLIFTKNNTFILKISIFILCIIVHPTNCSYHKRKAINELKRLNQSAPSKTRYLDGSQFQSMSLAYNCLYTINNYNNIDLKFETYPIIMRRPELVFIDKMEYYFNEPLIWVPYGYQQHPSSNIKFKAKDKRQCYISKYLSDCEIDWKTNYHSPDLCLRLNLPMYSVQTKPWNCQMDLHLLPPPKSIEKYKYPESFKMPRSEGSEFMQMMLPSMRPAVVALVAEDTSQLGKWVLESKSGPSADDPSPLVLYKEFVYFEIRKKSIGKTLIVSFDIKGDIHFRNFNTKFIEKMWNGKDEELTMAWNMDRPGEFSFKYHDAIMHHLAHCGNDVTWGHTNRANLPLTRYDEFNNRLYLGLSLVWLSIWGNYSYEDNSGKLCLNGIRMNAKFHGNSPAKLNTRLVEPESTLYFPLSFNDSLQNIKFVSCGGSNGVEGIAFAEMYNVFDSWIWIWAAVSVGFVSLSLSWTLTVGRMEKGVIFRVWHSLKIYLEQNGPYPDYVNMRSKPIIGATLLVGIVLSNAYKNANVYNMILPRKVVPFTDVTELVSHHFSIYTRPSLIYCHDFYMNCYKDYYWVPTTLPQSVMMKCTVSGQKGYCKNQRTGDGKYKELEALSDLEVINGPNNFNTKTKDGASIKDISRLMPVQNVFIEMSKAYNSPDSSQVVRDVKTYTELRHSAESNLLKLLKSCNSSAAVVSEYLTRRFEQKLKTLDFKKVFVGKDRYFDANHGFKLQGKMHRNVAKRIQAIKVSGIWDWWPKYARNYFDFSGEQESNDVPTPSMEGNIQVIFCLLAGGLVITIVAFIAECIKRILLVIVKGLKNIANVFCGAVFYAGKLKCGCVERVKCFKVRTKVMRVAR